MRKIDFAIAWYRALGGNLSNYGSFWSHFDDPEHVTLVTSQVIPNATIVVDNRDGRIVFGDLY
jgi:hypothetical protein